MNTGGVNGWNILHSAFIKPYWVSGANRENKVPVNDRMHHNHVPLAPSFPSFRRCDTYQVSTQNASFAVRTPSTPVQEHRRRLRLREFFFHSRNELEFRSISPAKVLLVALTMGAAS